MKLTMKYNFIKGIVKGAHNDTQHPNSTYPDASPMDCDKVQLTNAQCHKVFISISWYR